VIYNAKRLPGRKGRKDKRRKKEKTRRSKKKKERRKQRRATERGVSWVASFFQLCYTTSVMFAVNQYTEKLLLDLTASLEVSPSLPGGVDDLK
jgi:hypothetical protein